ncbi:MAG: glutamine-hydrolyzing carbamoyl-phosphate synthase small subunit [Gammaproteobacteria bacterium]|nr:glutamine-hydrolyzing carbamoyl-phosphate synthase small subunit [Gammaproteobacteria bacterium]MDD9870968.1 glutamine-hydrolyzing carbamoyl-phosphate synthase small subunit [Gammaproteobacteria bacterium]
MIPAILVLADGTVFRGRSVGAAGVAVGEAVFNTAMTGYQEILTDPSYTGQVVTLTCPHVGNTGANAEDWESAKVHAAGLVVRDCPQMHSNWRAGQGLGDFLKEQRTVAVSGVDTRKLTRLLRSGGAQNACIAAGDAAGAVDQARSLARGAAAMAGRELAREVATKEAYEWHGGPWRDGAYDDGAMARRRYHVAACDFGAKHNILRELSGRGCRVTVLPAAAAAGEILTANNGAPPDGVFLANGPGDPEPCVFAVEAVRAVLKRGVPLFGICLGHQLLALACGARTEKMKFGHHGANHPVQDLDSGRVSITSQNHGFTVSEKPMPEFLRVTHRSLFDGTIQGLEHREKPAFSFQGHPEASPGPHDVNALFDRFIHLMDARRAGVS